MSLKTREEIKRDCWDIVRNLSTFNYNNPVSPEETFKRLITIIDALYDEIEKKNSWHTDAPKENGTYIVQLRDIHGIVILSIASLDCGCWSLDSRMLEEGFHVEAWTELPEFYKEETNDRKAN